MRQRGQRGQRAQRGAANGGSLAEARRRRPAAAVLRAWILILAVLPIGAAAQAQAPDDEQIRPFDIVRFKNPAGRVEEIAGELLAETFEQYEIRTMSGGTIKLRRDQVVEIVRRRSAEDVYRAKLKKVPGNDDPAARAGALLALGIWCRTPIAGTREPGSPPAPEHAYQHLLTAARLQPGLVAAYPHLLDIIAERRAAGAIERDEEVATYLLAEDGGFQHPEIDLRLGEIYLETHLEEEAARRFERVLAQQSADPNRFLARRARHYLSQIYLARGEFDRAIELYQAVSAGGDAFEGDYLAARLLLQRGLPEDRRRARDLLQKARNAQPDFPGVSLQIAALDFVEGKIESARTTLLRNLPRAPNDPEYLAGLGLVELERGRFAKAQDAFDKALAAAGDGAGPVVTQARLGRGLLLEAADKRTEAVAEYRQAVASSPGDVIAALVLSNALLRAGDLDDAAVTLEKLLEVHEFDELVVANVTRALADVEVARRNEERARILLGYAIELQETDPFLHRKLGMLLLRRGEFDAAHRHLERARELGGEQPELLCALGFYFYSQSRMQEAEEAFRKVLKLVPAPARPATGSAPPVPIARVYAERGLMNVADVHGLEVWEDAFDREDGEEIHRGWLKRESFGVRIALEGGSVLFKGAQANDAAGVTTLYREVEVQDVERVSVRLRVPAAGSFRTGLRLETPEESVGIGLLLYRDPAGTVRVAVKSSKSDWEDLKPAPATEGAAAGPLPGKMVYREGIPWPADDRWHLLMIRAADTTRGGRGYDALFDGEPVALNVPIGSFGRGTRVLLLGTYAQGLELGAEQEVRADDFRVFRKKAGNIRTERR